MVYINNFTKTVAALVPMVLLLLMVSEKLSAQCSNWYIKATSDTTSCAGNATVKVALSGTSILTNRLYSLTSTVTGGVSYPATQDSIFHGVADGAYKITVQGVCGGVSMTKDTTIVVKGSYTPMEVDVTQRRAAWLGCNSGQASFNIRNGRAPFSIIITGAPFAYTGRTTFKVRDSYVVDSLAPGTYTFIITDSCGTSTATKTQAVAQLGAIRAENIYSVVAPPAGECNKIHMFYFQLQGAGFADYSLPGSSPVSFAYSIDTIRMSSFKPVSQRADTITLPTGWSTKNTYGKILTIYIKDPCGNITPFTDTIDRPTFTKMAFPDYCHSYFDLGYYVQENKENVCYPVSVKVTNTATNQVYADAIPGIIYTTSYMYKLPFGDYKIEVSSADGYKFSLANPVFSVTKKDSIGNAYSATVSSSGVTGDSGYAYITLKKNSRILPNTTVELLSSPNDTTYFNTIYLSLNSTTTTYTLLSPGTSNYNRFVKGSYLFRVTDSCGVYLVPVTISADYIYTYTWTYKSRQTCRGLEIIPNGTAMQGNSPAVEFYMVTYPFRYDTKSYRNGDTIILKNEGYYTISMGNYAGFISDYGSNSKSFEYGTTPVAVDATKTFGWVCPSASLTSGTIKAYAKDGSIAIANSSGIIRYTFRLAAEGNGGTGPYLASNTTGVFSSATSGGAYTLVGGQSYDIRVEDECGAASVQTVKVVNFATAEVVTTDRPEYCEGETVHFKVINLPSTATRYRWTGPNNFKDTTAGPILNMTKAAEGEYRVAISADMCLDSIIGTVSIKEVPYLKTCYSAITDTSVNPYTYGLMGNWRPKRTLIYYGVRAESDPNQPTNIRTDGAYAEFNTFWQKQDDKWRRNQEDKRWVWNAQTTSFNSKGFELETRDPLGRYNAGLYGYDNSIPIAVVQNSRYQEAAFEGFEDYDFGGNTCDTVCVTGRHFDFSIYKSQMDSTEKHTGRYSLRVEKGDTVGINATVMAAGRDLTDIEFEQGGTTCSPWFEYYLKRVRAGKEIILPPFAPIAGKKLLFSAWVKEKQDCKCMAYDYSQVTLAVMDAEGGRQPVKIKPIGAIIDGWQRFEQVIEVPVGSQSLSIVLLATGNTTVYFDDLRVHPYNANMKSFVYDPLTLRMIAELDENNYATLFEYDEDGTLIRVKKETERGVKTIKETRSALIKQ